VRSLVSANIFNHCTNLKNTILQYYYNVKSSYFVIQYILILLLTSAHLKIREMQLRFSCDYNVASGGIIILYIRFADVLILLYRNSACMLSGEMVDFTMCLITRDRSISVTW